MKKIFFAPIVLVFIFYICIPLAASTTTNYPGLYEAYGIEENGDDQSAYSLSKKMQDNPPQVIVLKPVSYSQPYLQESEKLSGTEIILKLGQSADYGTSIQMQDENTKLKLVIQLQFHYVMEDDVAILKADTKVDFSGSKHTYVFEKLTDEWVNYPSGRYHGSYNAGMVTHENWVIGINTNKSQDSPPVALGEIWFEIVGAKVKGGPTPKMTSIINRNADETSGETSETLPLAIVVGVAGLAVAAVGAAAAGGAAGSGDPGRSGEQGGSTYKMVLYKDFGDKIRIGPEPVYVHAKLMEINAQGQEVDRPDLTQQIRIFSPDQVFSVDKPVHVGGWMRSSVVLPYRASLGRNAARHGAVQADTGIVSFSFTGEGGMFQNNVSFNIIGESQIRLAADRIAILGTSTEKAELEYQLVDFLHMPEVTLSYHSDIGLFTLELGKSKTGKTVIVATPTAKAGEMRFQRFVHRYACEITAKTDKEAVTEKFELHLCYEGIGTAFEKEKNNTTPEEIVLECFSDDEKDKREEKAYRLPLAVMRWNKAVGQLEPDTQLAGQLNLEFMVNTKTNLLPVNDAMKVLQDAEVTAKTETGPSPVPVVHDLKPALFMLAPESGAVSHVPEIELIILVSVESGEFEPLSLDAKLKPQMDYRGMISWFLQYGQGTFVHKHLKIGEVDIYHGALDFIQNRVYSQSNCPYSPRVKDNHYEDGFLDVRRPNYVYLLDGSTPNQIGDFQQIQSLHHELCHAIEHQNGDYGVKDDSERHSYFIQHLANVVKELADVERGADVQECVRRAIQFFYRVFFDEHNRPNQTFSWFGVTYVTQHRLFADYANFDTYGPTTMSDDRKQAIATTFKEMYFPGALQVVRNVGAKYKETSGTFRNAVWTIQANTVYKGLIGAFTLFHMDYAFTATRKPQWVPNTLKIEAMYDVEHKPTGKRDTLMVELDGGSFNPDDYHYPKVDKFIVTWRATTKISDCIMGQPKTVTEAICST